MLPFVIVLSSVSLLPFGIGYSRVDTTTYLSLGWFVCGCVKLTDMLGIVLLVDVVRNKDINRMSFLIFASVMAGAAIKVIFDNALLLGYLCSPKIEDKIKISYFMDNPHSTDRQSHTAVRNSAAIEYIFAEVGSAELADFKNQPYTVLTMTKNEFHSYYQYNPDMYRLLTGLRAILNHLDKENSIAKDNGLYSLAIQAYASMQIKYDQDKTAPWAHQFKDIRGKRWAIGNCEDISTKAIDKLLAAYQGYKDLTAQNTLAW